MSHESAVAILPQMLFDESKGKTYRRQRFLGKGGFAKCYEIIDVETKNIFACKTVSKKLIIETGQKKKMRQEIDIHRTLEHENILKFLEYFEDSKFVYILLELCENQSMFELHKRRRTITAYECRYFMTQLVRGVQYLHNNRIIHRDLKLANLMLDDGLHVKIGDFGLATLVENDAERKLTICGTPNYIAPEVLSKKGHSFEVDIWSIGCIMYTLLVGRPPFETRSVKATYAKIKNCEYEVPRYLRKSAAAMIMDMLTPDPSLRPKANDLPNYEFLCSTIVPKFLPRSCLTMAPRLEAEDKETLPKYFTAAAHARDRVDTTTTTTTTTNTTTNSPADASNSEPSPFLNMNSSNDSFKSSAFDVYNKKDCYIDSQHLCRQLNELINRKKTKILDHDVDVEHSDPKSQPLFWISKWIDYSDRYGFGYQLNDDSIGVLFNDGTKLMLLPNQLDVHYIDFVGNENYMTLTKYCASLRKKMQLLGYFKNYMIKNLMKTDTVKKITSKSSDCVSRMPHLHAWFRTSWAVCMFLSNGLVQINFGDHIKLILCPRMKALTHIDKQRNFRTFRFRTIAENGCSKDLYEKLRYGYEKIAQFLKKLK